MTVVRGDSVHFVDLVGRRAADPLTGISASSSLRLVELTAGERRHAHEHPYSEEVVYVAAGSGRVWIDGVVETVGPGDVVRIPPATLHATVPDPDVRMKLVCFFPHPDLAENIRESEVVVDVGL